MNLDLFSAVIEEQGKTFSAVPATLLAADNHNWGNDGFSWFSPKSWYNAVTQLPSFAAVSVLSGANSFYNTGVAVANFFGAEAEYNDTAAWITDLDSDLGQYYSENRRSADLVGFIAGSFIPGLAGVKALSAGQKALSAAKDSGYFGTGIGRAVGLLHPSASYWTQQSVRQIATAQTTFSAMNANTLRAVGSGFGEAALQSLAFETAVAATMFKSPILEDMDLENLAKNIAFGAVLGTGIGGIFSAAKTFGTIKKSVTAVDEIEKAFTFTPQTVEKMAPADKIVMWLDFLKNTPTPEIGAAQAALRIGEDSAMKDFVTRFTQQAAVRDGKVWNAVREELNKISPNPDVTETLFNAIRGMDSDQVMKNLLGAGELGKAGDVLKIAKEIRKEERSSIQAVSRLQQKLDKLIDVDIKAYKNNPAIFSGVNTKPIVNELEKFVRAYRGEAQTEIHEAALQAIGAIKKGNLFEAKEYLGKLEDLRMGVAERMEKKIVWIKTWGDDAGKVVAEKPKVLSISDVEGDVKAFVDKQKFLTKTSVGVDELLSDANKVQARYIWASTLTQEAMPDIIKGTDLPVLERAYILGGQHSVQAPDGSVVKLSGERLFSFIQQTKDEMANSLLQKRVDLTAKLAQAKSAREAEGIRKELDKTYNSDDIAKLLNVRRAYLEGDVMNDPFADIFAYQTYQKKYQEDLIKKGLWREEKGAYELFKLPQWVQVGYRTDILYDTDGNVIRGLAMLKAKEKLYMQAINNVLYSPAQMGAIAPQFFDIPEQAVLQSNRFGAGAGLFSFANGNYGSLASMVESIGASTGALKIAKRQEAREIIEAPLLKLRNNSEAALELQAIFQRLASTTENYVLMPNGVLRPQKLVEAEAIAANGKRTMPGDPPTLQEGAPLEINVIHPETLEVIQAHVRRNGDRLMAQKERAALRGEEMSLRPDVLYIPKPDPRDYPHFFFVVDETVAADASGRVRMVHAATAKDLEALRNKIGSDYKVVTKSETEEYFKALGQYNYDRTLHNSNMDVNLRRRGVNSQFLPKTDPVQITDDLLNWHLRQEDIAVRDMVSLRYSKEFAELEKLGEQYTGIALSRYGYDRKFAENVVKNPYVNYIKTALDISKIDEYPILATINRTVDRAFSEATRAIGSVFARTTGPQDLEQVNSAMERYGLKTAFADVDALIAANHTAPRGALTKFVRDANALLATTLLRLDPLNAINNAVGAQVMLGTETKSVLRAIEKADSAAAGKLAQLMSVTYQDGTKAYTQKTAGKLISNALQTYARAIREPDILQRYRDMGYVTDLTTQYHRMMDDLTLRGTESVNDLNSRIQRAYGIARNIGDKGEVWTGNRHAEELNRFISAHVMSEITDEAVFLGVMSQAEAIAYVRTFVNRTQGNIIASQRPMIFQGPIGQAIGLFQTYQFNLIQQLLRYVGEGTAKDAAMLLGLQGTIYGLNGLPAFSFINQHIVGTASGNREHTDLYTATYGVFGNNVADVLMYGLPSNLLGTNLFTRGDINPRHPTILPINPADVPLVSAYGKFFSSMEESIKKMANGGAIWESLLQGIEHNGLSRPAAGLAQVLRGFEDGNVFSTSSRGNILGTNDLFSWASVTRLLGGKPFDEARLIDTMHRMLFYSAHDRSRRLVLGETFKTITVDGSMPSPEDIENFAVAYTERGGDIRNFNKWMMEQIKNSQTSQVNKIAENLKSPLSQHMQLLMGGEPYMDGRSF